jgi:hypothetical protein
MRNSQTLALLSKHKQLIILAIGVAAMVSYIVPFGNLFAVADASSDWFKKTTSTKPHNDKFKFVKFKHLFSKFFPIKDSFNTFGVGKLNVDVDQRNKVIGGDIKNIALAGGGGLTGGGATAVNFGSTYTIVQNNVNVCAGFQVSCTQGGNTVSISTVQNLQYNAFGGSINF